MEIRVTVLTMHEGRSEAFEFLASEDGLELQKIPDRVSKLIFTDGDPSSTKRAAYYNALLRFGFHNRNDWSARTDVALRAGLPFRLFLPNLTARHPGAGRVIVDTTVADVKTEHLYPRQNR